MSIYVAPNGHFFRMIRPVGSWNIKGHQHYALWRPVWKCLWFYLPKLSKKDFWLDESGFTKVK